MLYMVHTVKGTGNYAVIHERECSKSRKVATIQPSNLNHQWFGPFETKTDVWSYANTWKRLRPHLNRSVRACGLPHCARLIRRRN